MASSFTSVDVAVLIMIQIEDMWDALAFAQTCRTAARALTHATHCRSRIKREFPWTFKITAGEPVVRRGKGRKKKTPATRAPDPVDWLALLKECVAMRTLWVRNMEQLARVYNDELDHHVHTEVLARFVALGGMVEYEAFVTRATVVHGFRTVKLVQRPYLVLRPPFLHAPTQGDKKQIRLLDPADVLRAYTERRARTRQFGHVPMRDGREGGYFELTPSQWARLPVCPQCRLWLLPSVYERCLCGRVTDDTVYHWK